MGHESNMIGSLTRNGFVGSVKDVMGTTIVSSGEDLGTFLSRKSQSTNSDAVQESAFSKIIGGIENENVRRSISQALVDIHGESKTDQSLNICNAVLTRIGANHTKIATSLVGAIEEDNSKNGGRGFSELAEILKATLDSEREASRLKQGKEFDKSDEVIRRYEEDYDVPPPPFEDDGVPPPPVVESDSEDYDVPPPPFEDDGVPPPPVVESDSEDYDVPPPPFDEEEELDNISEISTKPGEPSTVIGRTGASDVANLDDLTDIEQTLETEKRPTNSVEHFQKEGDNTATTKSFVERFPSKAIGGGSFAEMVGGGRAGAGQSQVH